MSGTILIRSPKRFKKIANIKASQKGVSTPKYLEELADEIERGMFNLKDIKKKKGGFDDFFKI